MIIGVPSKQVCTGLSIMIDRSHQCWTASAFYDLLATPWWLIDSKHLVCISVHLVNTGYVYKIISFDKIKLFLLINVSDLTLYHLTFFNISEII